MFSLPTACLYRQVKEELLTRARALARARLAQAAAHGATEDDDDDDDIPEGIFGIR